MLKAEAKKRIEKLKKTIDRHRYLYHVLDRQEISDAALDSLKRELSKLEREYPEFLTSDSPTQRVAGKVLAGFKKITHKIPMLSIEDIFNEQELGDWEMYLKRLEPTIGLDYFGGQADKQGSRAVARGSYFAELKIDGFAVSLVYRNGVFSRGATRGDGKMGEDITQNLKTIESVPLILALRKKLADQEMEKKLDALIRNGEIEIRGEVYMDKDDFEEFNKSLEKKEEKTYANPRNLAAGSVRQLDSGIVALRPLKFLAYDMVADMGQATHSEEHSILSALGFKTDFGKICKNLSDIVRFRQEIIKKREKLTFQIDGIVISVNNNNLFRKLGISGKSPRAIRAFKFSPKQATTKILDIKLQVGRTGAITPLAYLEPVEVGGVIITRATLHNEDEVKKLGIKIGDTVIVERAGDVIPAVAKVLKELRTGREKEFHFPKECPVCGTFLKKPEGEAIWRCPNQNCLARKRENLYHFVSKKSFNIEGLGPKIIDQLADANLVSQASDIFNLKKEDLRSLERFGEKSAQNILNSIYKSKAINLHRFIYSLGIRHVGEETAIDLAEFFGNINGLKNASTDELEKIPNIGKQVSESIFRWFQSPKNRKMIADLLEAGIKIFSPEKREKKLAGKTFVLTGSLEAMTRSEAHKKIRILSGNPANSVSRSTDYLVAGKEPGSNLDKARKLGVKIITEKEFLDLIT